MSPRRTIEKLHHEQAARILWSAAMEIDAAASRVAKAAKKLREGEADAKFQRHTDTAVKELVDVAIRLRQGVLGPRE